MGASKDDGHVTYKIQDDEESLLAAQVQLNRRIEEYVKGYLWQQDDFRLEVANSDPVTPGHLKGTVRYGDNVEDEWLCISIVFLLTQGERNLIARVWDSDGEILLIESAERLPKWLEPDTATNRVFVHAGKLHILPRDVLRGEAPTLREALQALLPFSSSSNPPTQAGELVQESLRARMRGYPERAVRESPHRSFCFLPLSIAKLLQRRPQLLSAAVRCFYARGPEDVDAASRMVSLLPSPTCVSDLQEKFGGGRRGYVQVRFTRCLYAQLVKQTFFAPRGFQLPDE